MNIHEHQAKELLREFGASVPKGVVIYNIDELTWGMNLTRFIQRKYETIIWVGFPLKIEGVVSKYGHLNGIKGIFPPAKFKIKLFGFFKPLKPNQIFGGIFNNKFFFSSISIILNLFFKKNTNLTLPLETNKFKDIFLWNFQALTLLKFITEK